MRRRRRSNSATMTAVNGLPRRNAPCALAKWSRDRRALALNIAHGGQLKAFGPAAYSRRQPVMAYALRDPLITTVLLAATSESGWRC